MLGRDGTRAATTIHSQIVSLGDAAVRILLVADLHYNLRQFDWVVDHVPDHDVVVIAGDHLNIASPVALEAQIAAVRATFVRLAPVTRLIACSGNHDLDRVGAFGEKTAGWLATLQPSGVCVDGESASVGDTTFTVMPWWDGPVSRRQLEAKMDALGSSRPSRWIWVYHSPPEGPLSWTGSRHFGDTAIREWVERWQPDLVLCGHIHQAPFSAAGSWVDRIGSTWLFNAGMQIGRTPARIEIDLERSAARWVSLMGTEEISLVGEGLVQ